MESQGGIEVTQMSKSRQSWGSNWWPYGRKAEILPFAPTMPTRGLKKFMTHSLSNISEYFLPCSQCENITELSKFHTVPFWWCKLKLKRPFRIEIFYFAIFYCNIFFSMVRVLYVWKYQILELFPGILTYMYKAVSKNNNMIWLFVCVFFRAFLGPTLGGALDEYLHFQWATTVSTFFFFLHIFVEK